MAGDCVMCGRPIEQDTPRDLDLERRLCDEAGTAAAFAGSDIAARSLRAFADHRAYPGGIRPGRDFVREMREELADFANYACWEVQQHHAGYLAGDPEASGRVAEAMDALAHVVAAWHALRP